MLLPLYVGYVLSICHVVFALVPRVPGGIQVTTNVFPLVARSYDRPITPSSQHLHRRRRRNARRQVFLFPGLMNSPFAMPGLVPAVQPQAVQYAQPQGVEVTQPQGFQLAQPQGFQLAQPQGVQGAQPVGAQFAQPPGVQVIQSPGFQASPPPGDGVIQFSGVQFAQPPVVPVAVPAVASPPADVASAGDLISAVLPPPVDGSVPADVPSPPLVWNPTDLPSPLADLTSPLTDVPSPIVIIFPPIDASTSLPDIEPSPMVIEPSLVVTEPSPVVIEPSPLAVDPSPLVVDPSPVVIQPFPVVVEPSSVAVEPSSVAVEPSTLVIEPSTLAIEPSPPVHWSLPPLIKSPPNENDPPPSKPPVASPGLVFGTAPSATSPSSATVPDDLIEEDVDTISGRVYMTNISLANHPYTLILDTGSSDTWIAASNFQCTSRLSRASLPQESCGFGELYDAIDSPTYEAIPGRTFGVKYSDGEYLMGRMGIEDLSVGGDDEGGNGLTVRQTIGLVQKGWWMGDGLSSGLMGLAFPTLASNYHDLNYTTVVGSLFETHEVPPIFSLALSRPTIQAPAAGGLLAIGGIPEDVPYSGSFVSVPITPVYAHTYAFYTVPVDGFSITPPSSSSSPPDFSSSSSSHRIPPFANISATPPADADAPIPEFENGPQTMIVDSGSTLIYLPDDTADYIASLFNPPARYVPSSNTYITSCQAEQPRFGVIVGGTTFYVNPEDMLSREGKGHCSLAIQRQEDGDGVLGDAWLKNVLVVFDLGDKAVRIAAREVY